MQGANADYRRMIGPNGPVGHAGYPGLYHLCFLAESDARHEKLDLAISELGAAENVCRQVMDSGDFFSRAQALSKEEAHVLGTLRTIVGYTPKDPYVVSRAIEFMDSLPPQPNVVDALKVNCTRGILDAMKYPTIESWKRSDEEITARDRLVDKYWMGPRIRRLRALETRLERETILTLDRDKTNWETASKAYQAVDAKMKGNAMWAEHSYWNISVLMLEYWGRNLAWRRVTRTALRLQAQKIKTGVVPASIPNYGDDSVDPYTHKPLSYRLEGDGFVVYSVGKDRIDNGGDPSIAPGRNKDIVVAM